MSSGGIGTVGTLDTQSCSKPISTYISPAYSFPVVLRVTTCQQILRALASENCSESLGPVRLPTWKRHGYGVSFTATGSSLHDPRIESAPVRQLNTRSKHVCIRQGSRFFQTSATVRRRNSPTRSIFYSELRGLNMKKNTTEAAKPMSLSAFGKALRPPISCEGLRKCIDQERLTKGLVIVNGKPKIEDPEVAAWDLSRNSTMPRVYVPALSRYRQITKNSYADMRSMMTED